MSELKVCQDSLPHYSRGLHKQTTKALTFSQSPCTPAIGAYCGMATLYFRRSSSPIRPRRVSDFDLCIEVRQSLRRELLLLFLFELTSQFPPERQHHLWPLLAPPRLGR